MQIAEKIIALCKEKNLKIATAESFTGGLIADSFVQISGSSDVFLGGFIVNTNEAKIKLLKLNKKDIEGTKVYSQNTAILMAESALLKTGADFAVSSTGVAEGESMGVKAGTVYLGITNKQGKSEALTFILRGTRNEIRKQGAEKALEMLLNWLN